MRGNISRLLRRYNVSTGKQLSFQRSLVLPSSGPGRLDLRGGGTLLRRNVMTVDQVTWHNIREGLKLKW